mmetsp:Transcript_40296/g.105852  ORF Transcript_40296/g.105852 Transcript_40296/m.105852 type:complete len:215 (+) Transcript_40296:323-967(+)
MGQHEVSLAAHAVVVALALHLLSPCASGASRELHRILPGVTLSSPPQLHGVVNSGGQRSEHVLHPGGPVDHPGVQLAEAVLRVVQLLQQRSVVLLQRIYVNCARGTPYFQTPSNKLSSCDGAAAVLINDVPKLPCLGDGDSQHLKICHQRRISQHHHEFRPGDHPALVHVCVEEQHPEVLVHHLPLEILVAVDLDSVRFRNLQRLQHKSSGNQV